MIGIGADGSLLMRLGELEVFRRTGVVVPLVILNDQALGTMKSRQKSRGMPDYGLDFSTGGFCGYCQSLWPPRCACRRSRHAGERIAAGDGLFVDDID